MVGFINAKLEIIFDIFNFEKDLSAYQLLLELLWVFYRLGQHCWDYLEMLYSDKLHQNINFITSRTDDCHKIIFLKNLALCTNRFHVSLKLTLNVNLYNAISMFLLWHLLRLVGLWLPLLLLLPLSSPPLRFCPGHPLGVLTCPDAHPWDPGRLPCGCGCFWTTAIHVRAANPREHNAGPSAPSQNTSSKIKLYKEFQDSHRRTLKHVQGPGTRQWQFLVFCPIVVWTGVLKALFIANLVSNLSYESAIYNRSFKRFYVAL